MWRCIKRITFWRCEKLSSGITSCSIMTCIVRKRNTCWLRRFLGGYSLHPIRDVGLRKRSTGSGFSRSSQSILWQGHSTRDRSLVTRKWTSLVFCPANGMFNHVLHLAILATPHLRNIERWHSGRDTKVYMQLRNDSLWRTLSRK